MELRRILGYPGYNVAKPIQHMKPIFHFGCVAGVIAVSLSVVFFANAQTASVIYEDSVLAPWAPASLKGVYDYANTVKVFHGTASIYAYSSSSGRVGFSTQGVPQSLAGKGYFQFSAFSQASFRITPVLRSGTRTFRSSVTPVLPANQWTTFSVPLSKFLGLATNTIDRVDIQNDALPRAWYVDSIGFTDTASGATTTVFEKTVPVVSLAGVTQGTSVFGIVPLSVTASDNIGISQTQIRIDGAIRASASLTPETLSYSWDTGKIPNGPHSVQAVVLDGSGNTAFSVPVTVWVQNPVPPRPSAFPLVVYTDAVNSPWSASSSRATVDIQSSAAVYRGTAAIRIGSLPLGKLMFVAPSPIEANPYRYLEFAVYSATATQPIYPALRLNGRMVGLPAVTTKPGEWKFVSLPLAAAITTSSFALDYLEFRSDVFPREWSIDEIRLVSTSTVFDSEAPVVSLLFPRPEAMVSGTVALSASAADNVGVKGVQFKVDGVRIGAEDFVAPYGVLWNTLNVVRGTHTVWAEVRDAAGNKNTSALATVTVTAVPDVLPPTTPVGLVARAVSPSQVDLSWFASRDNVGVAAYGVYRDGGNFKTVTSTRYSDLNLSASTTYSYQISAFDPTGNESAKSVVVSVRTLGIPATSTDRVAPVVSITAPSSSVVLSGTVPVRALASDAVGVVGVQFQLDGVNLLAEDIVAPYEISWDTNTVPNVVHQLKAVARDAAGNRGVSQTVLVTVSNSGGGISTTTFAVLGYYAYWDLVQGYTPERIDFSIVTHVIHFAENATTGFPYFIPTSRIEGVPYINPITGQLVPSVQKGLIDAAHAANKKVLLGIAQVAYYNTPPALSQIFSDSGKTDIFVAQIANYITLKGYDGVDINWEYPSASDRVNFSAFLVKMRAALDTMIPRGTLTITVDNGAVNPANRGVDVSVLNSNVDYVIIESISRLAGAGNVYSGIPNALYHPACTPFDAHTLADSYSPRMASYVTNNGWAQIGLDKQRATMYMPTYFEWFSGVDGPCQVAAGISSHSYIPMSLGEVLKRYSTTTLVTDTTAKAKYFSFTDPTYGKSLVTYWDEETTTDFINLLKSRGFSSVVLYDLGLAYVGPTQMPSFTKPRDYILKAIGAAINGGVPALATADMTAPSVPAGLSATAVSASQINLSWSASTDNVGVMEYRIYRGGVQIGTSNTTGYQNTGLAGSTAYLYAVVAADAAGNVSAQSAGASATTFTVIVPTSTTTSTPSSTLVSTKFGIGNRVRTSANLNVRSTPSLLGTLMGTQTTGVLGTVLAGSTYADGYYWWNINYDTGADGWSVENFLVSATSTVIIPAGASTI